MIEMLNSGENNKHCPLDNSQKEKLIKMCKHIYGKYRFYWDEADRKLKEETWGIRANSGVGSIDNNGMVWITFENVIDKLDFEFKHWEIHWIDLCLNVLPKEIVRIEINKYGSGHLQNH